MVKRRYKSSEKSKGKRNKKGGSEKNKKKTMGNMRVHRILASGGGGDNNWRPSARMIFALN